MRSIVVVLLVVVCSMCCADVRWSRVACTSLLLCRVLSCGHLLRSVPYSTATVFDSGQCDWPLARGRPGLYGLYAATTL